MLTQLERPLECSVFKKFLYNCGAIAPAIVAFSCFILGRSGAISKIWRADTLPAERPITIRQVLIGGNGPIRSNFIPFTVHMWT